jgi:hypothetical protein
MQIVSSTVPRKFIPTFLQSLIAMLGFRSLKLNEPLNTIFAKFVASVISYSTQLRVKIWDEKS